MDVDDQRQSSSSDENQSEDEEMEAVNGNDDLDNEGDSSNSENEDEFQEQEPSGQENNEDESSEDEQDEGVESKKNSSDLEEKDEVSSMSEPESGREDTQSSPKKIVIKFDKQQLVVENGSNNHEVATVSESDDEGVRKSRRSRDKPRKRYDVSEQENEDDDGFEEEESPKSKRGRPKKTTITPSPEESVKKKRGRPKKAENGDKRKRLNQEDITAALEESYHEKPKRNRKAVQYDSGDEEEDEESESEKEDSASESEEDSDEQPEKKRKVQMSPIEENTRRSGRERKVPEKFEVIIPEKKKRKKKIITSDFSENEDSESDYGSKKRKRKKVKKLDKFNIYKKSPTKVKRKKAKPKQVESDASDLSELSEGEAEYAKKYKTMSKKLNKNGGQITAADYGEKKSSRVRKTNTKYVEEAESHSSDIASDYDPNAVVVEEEEMEGIQVILDYRKGKVGATGESTMIWTVKEHGDPNVTLETEELEDQYWIKWKGWSHLNNTWESQASLDAKKKGNLEVKGLRKLINYQVKVADYNMWKRRANPEDVEYQEVDIEMGRQLLQTYTEVDRIFSHRKNENNANDYYVKWKNLSYADSTWEDETVIKNYYKEELDLYNARKKAKTNPKNYKDSMKILQKKFQGTERAARLLGE